MKIINIILLLLITTFVFGQRGNTIFNTGTNEFLNFSRQDFIENNLTKVSAYAYSINKKGKLKKDSLLLYRKEFDITQNIIFGLDCYRNYQSHGLPFLTWYEFETYFNHNGQVIKEISRPQNIEKKVEYGFTNYDIVSDEIEYEYDNQQREVKRIYKRIEHHYSILKNTKDTFHFHTIYRPQINEYLYNSYGQKIKWFYTVDSTKYLRTKSYNPDKDSNAVRCLYCHPRFLNAEWKYDAEGKLIESISYTNDNLIHTKKNYFYDEQQRLIKQIDSTGWYLATIKPYLKSITVIQYSDTGKIVTEVNNTGEERFISKIVSYFNSNDKLIQLCVTFSETTENYTKYSFIYNKNKLIKVQIFFDNGTYDVTEYYYNEKELLIEERTSQKGKFTTLIRYYYE